MEQVNKKQGLVTLVTLLAIATALFLSIFLSGCTMPGLSQLNQIKDGNYSSYGNMPGISGIPNISINNIAGTMNGTARPSTRTNEVDQLGSCIMHCKRTHSDSEISAACQAGCYTNDAKKAHDANKCDKIAGLGAQNSGRFHAMCMGAVIRGTGDISACMKAQVQDYKDLCILLGAEGAAGKVAEELCERIENRAMKQVCITTKTIGADDTTTEN